MIGSHQGWGIHPGRILHEVLQAQGRTQSALAAMLRRPPQVICEIVVGKKSITADTALDLQQGLGISAEFWVHAQAEHDLWSARRRRAEAVGTVPAPPAVSEEEPDPSRCPDTQPHDGHWWPATTTRDDQTRCPGRLHSAEADADRELREDEQHHATFQPKLAAQPEETRTDG